MQQYNVTTVFMYLIYYNLVLKKMSKASILLYIYLSIFLPKGGPQQIQAGSEI